jgi:hypothetical protein
MKTPREIILIRHQAADAQLREISAHDLAAIARCSSASTSRTSFAARVFKNFWHEAILPWRRVWIGMAAVWLGILVLNFMTRDPTNLALANLPEPSPQIQLALAEQRRLLAETLNSPTEISRPKIPGPRSELRLELYIG